MPELPEVEVVRRSLNTLICGLKITKVDILNNKLRYVINPKLKKVINKQKIISVKRRGKFLLINIENNKTLLFHLGMTGKILILNKKKNITMKTSFYYNSKIDKKHNHIKIKFNNYIDLIYNDIRKFGFIKLLKTQDIKNCINLSSLGPEPLGKKFNFKYFKKKSLGSKKNIKNFLMDQKYVSGLGNIYVNEILFLSSINPKKLTFELSNIEIIKILKNTRMILSDSINQGGSSIKDFKGILGERGGFQQNFRVYDRNNESCMKKTCDGMIKKIYLSNRSTFFCQKCQK
tara:strand:+ start:481 stop:1347 length:867 start_codon:yes stop_codon:yes gene_type:complete